MKASDNVIQEYFSALLGEYSEAPNDALSAEITADGNKAAQLSITKSSDKVIKPAITSPKSVEPRVAPVKSAVKPVSTTLVSSPGEPKIASLPQVATAPLQKLLDGVSHIKSKQADEVQPDVATLSPVEQKSIQVEPELELITQTSMDEQVSSALEAQPAIPDEEFQVLYFKVAGMVLAVPLEQLGGIYSITDDSVRHIFGKPNWYKGLMPYRERQLSVVDTALWVMPEKYDEELAEKLNYQYLVMLKDSDWGLACEKLVTTSQLLPSETNWRQTMGKRPWLRGMVKQKMCALLNVDALIELLDTGLNSQNT